MDPPNQRLGKPDKLSQGTHIQTSNCMVQWGNTLDKKGHCRTPETERGDKREHLGETRGGTSGEHRTAAKKHTRIYSCCRKLVDRQNA